MQVKPLDQAVLEAVYPLAIQYYTALEEEIKNHQGTLALLQELKKGNIDLSEVAVSDNGWKRIPPEPEEDDNTV